ncbi:hypothetical protein HOK51_03505 [Candidatus Woesearchaeota archaeon]|jgi:hypothetical protein|nr:hypothetical protein [Candidatus Woesearchaeota archaeon]MBT6518887.1 hypothetical protein [Candidatus Woesearchaeota archaeon]MBT7368489.1 hypothetical protein [Candidatus Woesearchaeota archaeon]
MEFKGKRHRINVQTEWAVTADTVRETAKLVKQFYSTISEEETLEDTLAERIKAGHLIPSNKKFPVDLVSKFGEPREDEDFKAYKTRVLEEFTENKPMAKGLIGMLWNGTVPTTTTLLTKEGDITVHVRASPGKCELEILGSGEYTNAGIDMAEKLVQYLKDKGSEPKYDVQDRNYRVS